MRLHILHEERRELASLPAHRLTRPDRTIYETTPDDIREGENGWFNPHKNIAYVWESIEISFRRVIAMVYEPSDSLVTPIGDDDTDEDDIFDIDRFGEVEKPHTDYVKDAVKDGWIQFDPSCAQGMYMPLRSFLVHWPNNNRLSIEVSSWSAGHDAHYRIWALPHEFAELGYLAPSLETPYRISLRRLEQERLGNEA